MPRVLPLKDEIETAVQLLRASGLERAANRLERASANVLKPRGASKQAKRVRLTQLRFNGKKLKTRGALVVAPEQIEEMK